MHAMRGAPTAAWSACGGSVRYSVMNDGSTCAEWATMTAPMTPQQVDAPVAGSDQVTLGDFWPVEPQATLL